MMKKLALIIILCAAQTQQAAVAVKEQIEKIHEICIPLILQYQIIEMQKNNQTQPTQKECQEALARAYEEYGNQIKSLPTETKKKLISLIKKFKTVQTLQKAFTILYGEDEAEILIALLQQIAQQDVNEIAMLKQAIESIRNKTNFLDYLQNKTQENFAFVQNATSEEVEQAKAMLQNSNEYYVQMFNNIVIGFFKQDA